MVKWSRTLNIKNEWKLAKEGKLSIYDLSRVIADRLDNLDPFDIEHIDTDKRDLTTEFRMIDDQSDVEDFDQLMDELYDWADQQVDPNDFWTKVCWVKTDI